MKNMKINKGLLATDKIQKIQNVTFMKKKMSVKSKLKKNLGYLFLGCWKSSLPWTVVITNGGNYKVHMLVKIHWAIYLRIMYYVM